jgi:transcriptional regulator with XRE-family HTH domain
MSIQGEVGSALRRARRARGLTLRQLPALSNGRFTPTAVAGYERAERHISLERFCALCWFYGVAPETLLAEILNASGEDSPRVVDLTPIDEPEPIPQ